MMLQLLYSVSPGETDIHTTGLTQKQICSNAHAQAHTQKCKHLKKRRIRLILTKLQYVQAGIALMGTYMHYRYFRVLFVGINTIDSLSPNPKLNHQHYMLNLNYIPFKLDLGHRNTGRQTCTAVLTQLPAVLSLCPAALFFSPALPPPLRG